MSHPLPPGPRSRLANTVRLARAPLHHLPRWLARFGDPFRVPLLTGAVVITADPTALRTLFTADPDSFDIYSARSLLPILGAGSLILRAGPDHRDERRLLMPPFHGARMRTYGAAMSSIAAEQLRALFLPSSSPSASPSTSSSAPSSASTATSATTAFAPPSRPPWP